MEVVVVVGRVYRVFVIVQLVLTLVLIALPARRVIEPEELIEKNLEGTKVVAWKPEENLPSSARQIAFGLNLPVALTMMPVLWVGFGGKITDAVFVLGVGLFWIWLVPKLYQKRSTRWVNVTLFMFGVILVLCCVGRMRYLRTILSGSSCVWLLALLVIVFVMRRKSRVESG